MNNHDKNNRQKTEDLGSHGFLENIQLLEGTGIRLELAKDPGSFFPFHWHPAIEMIQMIRGSMEVILPQQSYTLHPGDCFLINPDCIHATKTLEDVHYILLQIPMDYVAAYLPNTEQLTFHWEPAPTQPQQKQPQEKCQELLHKMLQLNTSQPNGYLLTLHSLLFQLLDLLYQNLSLRLPGSQARLLSQSQERLHQVLSYTTERYNRPISIQEIAEVAGFQPQYFCRFFKKHIGITYLEYQNRLRLSHIYRDLLSTKAPLQQLLETHGFTNYKLFRRMFQEQFHTTPGKLRQQNRV